MVVLQNWMIPILIVEPLDCLNYVIFNGFNRKYNMASNRETLNFQHLQAKATLETVLISLFTFTITWLE